MRNKRESNYYNAVPLTAEECMTLHGLTLEEARKRGYRVCERKENKMDKEFYTVAEAAELLGISGKTIYGYHACGKIELVNVPTPTNPNRMIRMLSAKDFERIKNGEVSKTKPEPKEQVESVESEPKATADTQTDAQTDSIWREIAEDLIKAKPDNLWVKLKAVIRAEDCNI